MPFSIKCKHCEIDFLADRSNRVFCSMKCRGLSQAKQISKICKCCGKQFSVVLSFDKKGALYCSRECYLNREQRPSEDRFWEKVNKAGKKDCWLWIGATDAKNGYGKFGMWPTTRNAHSYSYELAYGSLPSGKQVNHTCDVRNCVNPAHLYAGTAKENTSDMRSRGRAKIGERHPAAKLTQINVVEIRESSDSPKNLAKRFGVTEDHITGIRRGHKWKDITNAN